MAQQGQRITLPGSIAGKLLSVRKRSFKVRLATAVVAAVVVLLAAMGVAMLVDYLATLYDSRWRVVLTTSALAAAGLTLVAWVLFGWRYTRRLDRSAAAVDREFPELEERWTTVASLADSPRTAQDVHPAMYQQVATEATRWSPRVAPERVVTLEGFVRALLCLTAVTAVLGLAVILDARQTTVLMRRFWAPGSLISATEITHTPGNTVVGRGEPLEIAASIEGRPVTRATLTLEPEEGEPQTLTLVPHASQDETRVTHRLRSVNTPVKYQLRAGDGQTPWYEVAVADRPKIDQLRLTVTPPAYTHKPAETKERLPRRLTVLEGSQLEIALNTENGVESVKLRLGPDRAENLSRDADGWYRWTTTVEKSFSLSPRLTEEHGLTNSRPPLCKVTCQPDRPPVVKVLTPQNDVAVRPDEKLKITFVAKDDVGIGSAELVVFDESMGGRSKPLPLKRIPIVLGEQQGATSVKASVDLDLAEFELADGAQLSYAVRVREDRGQTIQPPVEMASPAEAAEQVNEIAEAAQPQEMREAKPQADMVAARNGSQPDTGRSEDSQTATSAKNQTAPTAASSEPTPAVPKPTAQPPAETVARSESSPGESAASTGEAQPQKSEADTQTARTTTSDEQRVSAGEQAQSEPQENMPQEKKPQESENLAGDNEPTEPSESQQASSNQGNRSQQTAQQSDDNQQQRSPSGGNSPPPDNMSRNALDLPEPARSSTSQQMRLKVDQWAGSFEGQQREKLELVIAPLLAELDQNLEKAQNLSRIVLDETEDVSQWRSKHDRDVSQAKKRIVAASKIITDLEDQSHGTPYAFIGLQLLDINQAHVEPARREFWKSLQSEGDGRVAAVRNGWQHTERARELLVLLTERFERARREYSLAESVDEIKKMYRIFLEDSMALLQPPGDNGSGYSRKGVEFDFDEEYLERLKEVLAMRNKMRAELARILREDPRLLRRFLDAQRTRQNNMRFELEGLVEDQRELNRETKAWAGVEDNQREELAAILLGRHVEASQVVALSAAELFESFETWLPLERAVQDTDLQEAAELMQTITGSARELTVEADAYVASQLPSPNETPAESVEEADEEAPAEAVADPAEILARIDADAEGLYDELVRLEVMLRQLGLRSDRLDMASFATNRLVETRRLIAQSSAWVRQLREQQAGNYHRSAEVSQYQLAKRTEILVAKLADSEAAISNLLQPGGGGALPEDIAEKAREMFATFDEQVSPNQQAAIYALRRNQMSRATTRQASALAALELAAKKYDEMIRAAIEELDKLPVQDPIANLLDDPTLDELLAGLEQESAVEELLGIPPRRSNLQIVGDFLSPPGDNGIITGSNGMRLMNQMREQQRLRQRQLDRAYRRAVARAMKEVNAEDLVQNGPLKLAGENSDWNVLLSQLGDDLRQGRDKAPPERYRRAIEQYFRQISRSAGEEE